MLLGLEIAAQLIETTWRPRVIFHLLEDRYQILEILIVEGQHVQQRVVKEIAYVVARVALPPFQPRLHLLKTRSVNVRQKLDQRDNRLAFQFTLPGYLLPEPLRRVMNDEVNRWLIERIIQQQEIERVTTFIISRSFLYVRSVISNSLAM